MLRLRQLCRLRRQRQLSTALTWDCLDWTSKLRLRQLCRLRRPRQLSDCVDLGLPRLASLLRLRQLCRLALTSVTCRLR